MFSEAWEERFAQGKSHSIWAWTDVITYVNKYGTFRKGSKVLELGPGVGANIPFFLSIGADYYAVEGSKTAVSTIIKNYPFLEGKVILGDFTRTIPFPDKFKIIIDRSALTHNDTNSIMRTLSMMVKKLSDNGKYIGIDWFSWIHGERQRGFCQDDLYTYSFNSGKFEGCGKVHFSTKNHLMDIFNDAGLDVEVLDHKIIQNKMIKDITEDYLATWNLVASKKKL